MNPNYKGTFGVIAPYSKGFCDSCNRLRMSSTGNLHLCLFGEQGFSLRHLMQSESQREELKDTICNLLQKKKKQHFLHEGNSGGTPHLAAVGG